jgi:hypothetical protein
MSFMDKVGEQNSLSSMDGEGRVSGSVGRLMMMIFYL